MEPEPEVGGGGGSVEASSAAVALFNKKPKKGVAYAIENGVVAEDAAEVAT
eukprot:COSAG02_NODE_35451_length_468_cov_0.794038_1_plen_51_part_00